MLVLRSTSCRRDRPVEVFVAYHRGDRTRFEVDLERGVNPNADAVAVTAQTLEEVGP